MALKLSEYNTLRLLRLYKNEPCLYDVNSSDYRNREARIEAIIRIAALFSLKGFGPKEVTMKFKNIRNSYSQELKRIKDSEDSDEGEVYVPKVYWFNLMDSFLRPQMYSRHGQTKRSLISDQVYVNTILYLN